MGIRGGMARNTLANANRKRDWRIHADFAQALIRIARPLYAGEDLGLELDNTVYALDSSTVDLRANSPWRRAGFTAVPWPRPGHRTNPTKVVRCEPRRVELPTSALRTQRSPN